jgi:hypothetical protein
MLLSRRVKVMSLRKLGQSSEALSEARTLYADANDEFGPDQEDTLAAAITLATTLRRAGGASECWEAAEVADETAGRYERQFGPRHPLTLTARITHASTLRSQGQVQQALRMDEATLADLRNGLRPHPLTVCAANNVAVGLFMTERFEPGAAVVVIALDISRSVNDGHHPDTQHVAGNLALAIARSTDGTLISGTDAPAHARPNDDWIDLDFEPPAM